MYTSGRLNIILHKQRAEPGKRRLSLTLSFSVYSSHGVYEHRPSIMYYHSVLVLGVWPFNLQKVYSFGMRFYRIWVLRQFNSVMVSFCSGMPIYPLYMHVYIHVLGRYIYICIYTDCLLCRVNYNIIAEVFKVFSVNWRETIKIH